MIDNTSSAPPPPFASPVVDSTDLLSAPWIAFFLWLLSAQSAWTSFVPTLTPGGAMTLTGVTTDCAWLQFGKSIFLRISAHFTVGGTPNPVITLSLPFLPILLTTAGVGCHQILACLTTTGGGVLPGNAYADTSGATGSLTAFTPSGNWSSGILLAQGALQIQ